MFHRNNDFPGSAHQIHRSTHAVHFFTRNGPIGKITIFVNLKCTKYGNIEMASPCYGKGHNTVKAAGARYKCYQCVPGIVEVTVSRTPVSTVITM